MAGKLSVLLTVASALVSAVSIFITPQNGRGNTVTVSDEIQKAGYPVELHSVTTEDGYILGVHRIPYSPKSPDHRNKPVAYLQHGIFSCSGAFIATGPERALGYLLADLGYDVWMGNVRGNTYSRNHTTLNPDKDISFWNYSFHEHGVYDLPATIDYIIKITGQPKLFFVGYSQGATDFLAMASERPEYNDKIRAMFSLATIVTLADSEGPVVKLVKALRITNEAESLFGFQEIFRNSPIYVNIINTCLKSRVTQVICETMLYIFTGFDWEQINTRIVSPEVAKHTPSGASTKQGLHYFQGLSGKFRQYDYGRKVNLLRYGTEQPPEYNLSKITAPVALYYSNGDWLSSAKSVHLLYNELVRPIGKFLVPFPQFNHIDYMFAKDARTLVYNQVIDMMSWY